MARIDLLPANECIYCGISGVNLTDEHIIAFSLGGNFVLPKSSCDNCANVTKKLEQSFARVTMFEARSAHGIQTRRSKERATKVNVTLKFGKFGPERIVEIPIERAPITYVIQKCPLEKFEDDEIISRCIIHICDADEEINRIRHDCILRKFNAISATYFGKPILAGNLEILLWKIAIGVGWHYFRDALINSNARNYVLGTMKPYITGVLSEKLFVRDIFSKDRPHQTYRDARFAIFTKAEELHDFIYVEIDFLANLGLPLYYCRIKNVDKTPIDRIDFLSD